MKLAGSTGRPGYAWLSSNIPHTLGSLDIVSSVCSTNDSASLQKGLCIGSVATSPQFTTYNLSGYYLCFTTHLNHSFQISHVILVFYGCSYEGGAP